MQTIQNENLVIKEGNFTVNQVPAMGRKCTRCGRSLKKAYMVNGVPYGPVCVKKLFGIRIDRLAGPTVRRPIIQDTAQQAIFSEPTSGVIYRGRIIGKDEDHIIVCQRGAYSYSLRLEDSLQHVNHSPTGFCWGYGGSGPAQAAFAILYDYLNFDLERARSLYQDFKFKVVANLPMDKPFELTEQQIESALTAID